VAVALTAGAQIVDRPDDAQSRHDSATRDVFGGVQSKLGAAEPEAGRKREKAGHR
jgi:hypothetical protein